MSGRQFYFNIKHKFRQFLNPALCITCGITIHASSFFCSHCLKSISRVENPCTLCGLPNKSAGNTCPACLHNPPRWSKMVSPLSYEQYTRKLIHDLKFNEALYIANTLISHLFYYYSPYPVEALIPVPLHSSRLKERGYNQSDEIAKNLSERLNIPVDRTSLKRIKVTDSQSGLSLNKRQNNILKAFEYTPLHAYDSIAIIDDIITTGSTVSEVCKVLRKSGIKHIEVWSLARALRHN